MRLRAEADALALAEAEAAAEAERQAAEAAAARLKAEEEALAAKEAAEKAEEEARQAALLKKFAEEKALEEARAKAEEEERLAREAEEAAARAAAEAEAEAIAAAEAAEAAEKAAAEEAAAAEAARLAAEAAEAAEKERLEAEAAAAAAAAAEAAEKARIADEEAQAAIEEAFEAAADQKRRMQVYAGKKDRALQLADKDADRAMLMVPLPKDHGGLKRLAANRPTSSRNVGGGATVPVMNFGFMFIKPHANTEAARTLVAAQLAEAGITVTAEGTITAKEIDEKNLIDNHFQVRTEREMRGGGSRALRGIFLWSFGVSFVTSRVQFVFVWGVLVHPFSEVDLFLSDWGQRGVPVTLAPIARKYFSSGDTLGHHFPE